MEKYSWNLRIYYSYKLGMIQSRGITGVKTNEWRFSEMKVSSRVRLRDLHLRSCMKKYTPPSHRVNLDFVGHYLYNHN